MLFPPLTIAALMNAQTQHIYIYTRTHTHTLIWVCVIKLAYLCTEEMASLQSVAGLCAFSLNYHRRKCFLYASICTFSALNKSSKEIQPQKGLNYEQQPYLDGNQLQCFSMTSLHYCKCTLFLRHTSLLNKVRTAIVPSRSKSHHKNICARSRCIIVITFGSRQVVPRFPNLTSHHPLMARGTTQSFFQLSPQDYRPATISLIESDEFVPIHV